MNDQYPIGTICIYQNIVGKFAHMNGVECEIIGPLENRHARYDGIDRGRLLIYATRNANGVFGAQPSILRRKPPKQSDSQWADEAIRKLKKQSSDHVVIGKPELIPEEAA